MIIKDSQTIIDFLENRSTDYKGRTFMDIVECSDKKMEECRDQVQWMFPLHEESNFAQTYPIVTAETLQKAKNSPFIKNNLLIAKSRMEKFLAIGECKDIDIQRKWCQERNHNLLRITRVIRCLRLFGMKDDAIDFHDKALKAGNYFGISNVTTAYWWRALYEDIWTTLS